MTHAEIHPQHQRLAARLKELRQAAGLSAAALGQPFGWSQSKTSKMENGTSALVIVDRNPAGERAVVVGPTRRSPSPDVGGS